MNVNGSTNTNTRTSPAMSTATTSIPSVGLINREEVSLGIARDENGGKVRFSTIQQIHYTMPLNEYTPDELHRVWYQADEYETINNKTINLLRKMEAGKDTGYCTRGLERLVGPRHLQLQHARELAYLAVFAQQEALQCEHCPNHPAVKVDAMAMARVYHLVSQRCHHQASLVGNADAKVAARYCCLDYGTRSGNIASTAASSTAKPTSTTWMTDSKLSSTGAADKTNISRKASFQPQAMRSRRPDIMPQARARTDSVVARCA